MSRSAYGRKPCPICARTISEAGFARWSHMKAHERRGLVEERVVDVHRRRDGTRVEWDVQTRRRWAVTELGARASPYDLEAGDVLAW